MKHVLFPLVCFLACLSSYLLSHLSSAQNPVFFFVFFNSGKMYEIDLNLILDQWLLVISNN